MVEAKYNPEDDTFEIYVKDATTGSTVHERVNFKEFMDSIPTERARIESLLTDVKNVKKRKITKIGEFIDTIEKIVIKSIKVREQMEEAIVDGDHQTARSLRFVVQSLLDEKNTYREIRYAIKMLENEEGRLMAELARILV